MVSHLGRLFGRSKKEDEHAQVRRLSSDYIDCELDQEAVNTVEGHLAWCPPCEAFIATLRATVGLLGSSEMRQAPPTFKDDLRRRLQSDPNR